MRCAGWACLLVACSGRIVGDAPAEAPTRTVAARPAPTGSGETGPQAQDAPTPGGAALLPLPLQRLTREQYDRTLHDLLGDDTHPGAGLADDIVGDSGFVQSGTVTSTEVRGFMRAAEDVAGRLQPRVRGLLAGVPGCDALGGAAAETACVARFVERFGRRAFRRPLDAAEIDELSRHFAEVRAEAATFDEALSLLVATMLQSPSFLYRWDLDPATASAGGPDRPLPLGPYTVASRLSYFLWGTMPDDLLSAAADAGRLKTPAQIAEQARRMLRNDKAKAIVVDFHTQWLLLRDFDEVKKDEHIYPLWTPDLVQGILAEKGAFLDSVFSGDGKVTTLFQAPYSFVNEALAKVYGLADVTGPEVRRHDLDPAQRFGFLTQAGYIATASGYNDDKPFRRGRLIRERLLCQAVPAPPPDLEIPSLPSSDGKKPTTTRERIVQHRANPVCAGCHTLFDPLGIAFENYDAVGVWRVVDPDAKRPIDASGVLTGVGGRDVPFAGPRELVAALAPSEELARCLTTQWFRYAAGRVDGLQDQPSLDAAQAALKAAGGDMRELLVAIATSPSFITRTRAPGESGASGKGQP